MKQMWRIVLLGTIISCGVGLNAMDVTIERQNKKKRSTTDMTTDIMNNKLDNAEQRVLEQRSGLGCSQELSREELKRSAPIVIAALNEAEKRSQQRPYMEIPYVDTPCGNSPSSYSLYAISPLEQMKPGDPMWYI